MPASIRKAVAVGNTVTGDVIPAVEDRKFRIIAVLIIVCRFNSNEEYKLRSGAAGTYHVGNATFGAPGDIRLPYNPDGYFTTDVGVALRLEISGASPAYGGIIVYDEEKV